LELDGRKFAVDFFLLDTNLFRQATKSPGNQLLRNLIPGLQSRLGLEFGTGSLTAIRVSPFALLEALGIVPTMPAKLGADFATHSPKEIFKKLFDDACAFFRIQPELQSDYLRQKHDEQLGYINAEAVPLFEVCVTGILNRGLDLTEVFASFLATDYLFKYEFKRDEFIAMGQLLAASFFTDFPEQAPASRFRLSMQMFNLLRANLQSQPDYETLAAALKIKSKRDFLDTDIVQEIAYGFPHESVRHRVVALTFDNADVLKSRAIWHRQAGNAFAGKFTGEEAMREVVRPYLRHPGGLVIQSDPTGAIVNVVDLRGSFASAGVMSDV
jgi:hypothetical protein